MVRLIVSMGLSFAMSDMLRFPAIADDFGNFSLKG